MKKVKTHTKLVGAVAALTVAVALSAGTTFAWFTTNSSVSVSNINASVKADGGENLMIAVGHGTSDVTFKTSLDEGDIDDYLDNVELDATTYNGTSQTLQTATANGGAVTYSTATSGTYIRIPLTIRTDSAKNVYLGSSSAVTGSKSVSSTVSAGWDTMNQTAGYYTQGDALSGTITAYVKNAARVGITTGSGNLNATLKEYETESVMQIWSPNEALFTGAQYSSGTINRTAVLTDQYNYYKNNLAGSYYEYVNGLSAGTITQATYSNYLVTQSEGTGASLGESFYTVATTAKLTNAATGDPAYAFIYVYLWIEGTDGDCFNNILGQELSLDLVFTVPTSNS